MWHFQAGRIFFGSTVCTGSEVSPKSSILELHKLFQDHGKGHFLTGAGAQFHLRVRPFSSRKGNERVMQAF